MKEKEKKKKRTEKKRGDGASSEKWPGTNDGARGGEGDDEFRVA